MTSAVPQDAMTDKRDAKRKRVDSPDEFDDGGVDIDDLIIATDEAERSHKQTPTTTPKTPSRIPRNGLVLATERKAASEKANQVPWTGDVDTPNTSPAPATVPAKTADPSTLSGSGNGVKLAVSTPTAPRASPAPPTTPLTPSSVRGDNINLTADIMHILERQPINAAVRNRVKGQLETYSRQIKGIIVGRDMARAANRTKDEKIVALNEKIANQGDMIKFKDDIIKFKDDVIKARDEKIKDLETKSRGF